MGRLRDGFLGEEAPAELVTKAERGGPSRISRRLGHYSLTMPLTAMCHCGAIKIEVSRAPRTLTDCNCSICRRYGVLWAYYRQSTVRVSCAKDALAKYSWGRETLVFNRCKFCGCITHHQRRRKHANSTVGVNARNFEPSVVIKARVRRLDGAVTWKYLD